MEYLIPWSGRSIDYTRDDRDAVLEAMGADPQTQGKYLTGFEEVFSRYHGRDSFAVSSGAAALEIAAMLLNLTYDDEVIIPAHTYSATAIPFARRATVKWADIHPSILTVTAETIAPLITERTRAIIVVHLYGVNAPMSCIMKLAREKGIPVIEDCAQSLGVEYEYLLEWDGDSHIHWGKSGTHGDIACYSFHGQKNITTLGEGGMITVKSKDHAELIPGLRHNGHRQTGDTKVTDFDILGVYPYNFSIGEVQCAVGISQMKRLDKLNETRRTKARYIIDSLSDLPELEFQKIPRGGTHVYHNLCARHPKRDKLKEILAKRYGIECITQYTPLYQYPLFREFPGKCPVTEDFHKHALSFPFEEWYSVEMIVCLEDSIRRALKRL